MRILVIFFERLDLPFRRVPGRRQGAPCFRARAWLRVPICLCPVSFPIYFLWTWLKFNCGVSFLVFDNDTKNWRQSTFLGQQWSHFLINYIDSSMVDLSCLTIQVQVWSPSKFAKSEIESDKDRDVIHQAPLNWSPSYWCGSPPHKNIGVNHAPG